MNNNKIFYISIFSIFALISITFFSPVNAELIKSNSKELLEMKNQATTNNFAVVIGCGGFDWEDFLRNSASKFYNAINNGYWTEIRAHGKKLDNSYVTAEEIKDSIDWLYEKSQTGVCTLLFYYSGHGGRDNISADHEDIILKSDLRSWFDRFDTNDNLILIFDTCHSGTLVRPGSKLLKISNLRYTFKNLFRNMYRKTTFDINALDNDDQENEDFTLILGKQGRIVIAACKGSQSTWVCYGKYASVFTYYFIEGLKSISNFIIEGAFEHTDIKTSNYVFKRHHFKLQDPVISDNIPGDVQIKL